MTQENKHCPVCGAIDAPNIRPTYIIKFMCGSFTDDIGLFNNELIQETPECRIAFLNREIRRLKAGRFTPAELQNLCHTQSEDNCRVFCDGCTAYQRKLFGTSREDELVEDLRLTRDSHGKLMRCIKKILGYKHWPDYDGNVVDCVIADVENYIKEHIR